MLEQTFDLIIHFIALVFLTEILDSFEESIEAAIKKDIPDWFGFLIVWGIAYFVTWVGDWRFLKFLGYESQFTWGIWIELGLSSLIIAAGSNKLKKKFDLVNAIPAIINNIRGPQKPPIYSSQNSEKVSPYNYGPYDPKI